MSGPLEVIIRTGKLGDKDRLAQLGRDAFVETYGPLNKPEDMAQHVAWTYAISKIAGYLNDADSTYIVAEAGSVLAGFGLLCVNESAPESDDTRAAEIRHLYVLKQHQRLKLGSKLLEGIKVKAIEHDCRALWLGVWEHAHWARRFYEDVGFVAVGTHAFMLGQARQTDIVMSMPL